MSTYRMIPPPLPPPPLLGYEVDFFPVGNGAKSGDAIALRFGDLFGPPEGQHVAVIDGGFRDDGEALVNHITQHYHTDAVDLVVSTHPDQDHASGLAVVLERLAVRQLWMHRPWAHTNGIERAFRSARVSDASVEAALRKSLDDAHELERIAIRKRIPVAEPFTGTHDASGTLWVVSPSQAFYEGLLPDFRGTPDNVLSLTDMLRHVLRTPAELVLRTLETWNIETLGDNETTLAENNSSAVILASFPNGHSWLFTADAGIAALTAAAGLMDSLGIGAASCGFIQAPHHGSRHNVGPTILSRLVGPKLVQGAPASKVAFVSVSKDDPKHPSRRVVNALMRRGAKVYGTRGRPVCWSENAPARPGWTAIDPLAFDANVEDQDD